MAFNFSIAPRSNYELPSQIMRQSLESDLALRQAQEAERRLRQVDEDWRIQQAMKAAYGQTLNEAGAVADVRPMVQATKEQNLGPGPLQGLFSQESTQQKQLTEGAGAGLLAKMLGVNREKAMPSTGTPQSIGFQQAQPPQVGEPVDISAKAQEVFGQIAQDSAGRIDKIADMEQRGLIQPGATKEQIDRALLADINRGLMAVPGFAPVLPTGTDVPSIIDALNKNAAGQQQYKASVAGKVAQLLGRETPDQQREIQMQQFAKNRAENAEDVAARDRAIEQERVNDQLRAVNESPRPFLIHGKARYLNPDLFPPTPEGAAKAKDLSDRINAYHATEDMIGEYSDDWNAAKKTVWGNGVSANILNAENLGTAVETQKAVEKMAVNLDDNEMAILKAAEGHEDFKRIASSIISRKLLKMDSKSMIEALKYSMKSNTRLKSEVESASLLEGVMPKYRTAVGAARRVESSEEKAKKAVSKKLAESMRGPKPGGSERTAIQVRSPAEAAALPAGTWFKTPDGRTLKAKGAR